MCDHFAANLGLEHGPTGTFLMIDCPDCGFKGSLNWNWILSHVREQEKS